MAELQLDLWSNEETSMNEEAFLKMIDDLRERVSEEVAHNASEKIGHWLSLTSAAKSFVKSTVKDEIKEVVFREEGNE